MREICVKFAWSKSEDKKDGEKLGFQVTVIEKKRKKERKMDGNCLLRVKDIDEMISRTEWIEKGRKKKRPCREEFCLKEM